MPKEFLNIVELSRAFHEGGVRFGSDGNPTVQHLMSLAMLAQAQQLAVISGQLKDIADCLREIAGKAKQ